MAKLQDILNYYRPYRVAAIFSIVTTSIFEIVDLFVPYAIGQILNVLSKQPVDQPVQTFIAAFSNLTQLPANQLFSIVVLMGLVFLVTVVRAPIQVWSSWWFHWDIALRSRRDQSQKAIAKILSLPLEFYEENNPGRIAGRVARGLETTPGLTQKWQGN